jgi:predicted Fe-Mo cluster-binding NifX family protein
MNIAIAAQDKEVTSPVACHFGRCEYFMIYDEEKDALSILTNDQKVGSGCVGEAVLATLIEKQVKCIVAGDFGGQTKELLTKNEIRMVLLTDCSKTVGDIIRIVKNKTCAKIPDKLVERFFIKRKH